MIAVAVHAPIGLRNVLREWTRWRGSTLDLALALFALLLLVARSARRFRGFHSMMRAAHRQPGFVAALAHRLSGLALAVFLPLHFLALATALNGADALDSFLRVTRQPLVEFFEFAIVVALAIHMTLGLRVLAIELLDFREKTVAVLSACFAAVFAVGLIFILNLG